MTEYELGELLHNNYEGLWQGAQMYFTLVSAYLIVVYLIGFRLSRVQISIITGLYLVWMAGVILAQHATSLQTMHVSNELLAQGSSLLPQAAYTESQAGVFSFLVVQVLGIAASLWFMWSVRHPKTE